MRMIADGLTKTSAPTESLEQVLATGKHSPPGGFEIKPRTSIAKKLWVGTEALCKGKSLRNSKWASHTKPTAE